MSGVTAACAFSYVHGVALVCLRLYSVVACLRLYSSVRPLHVHPPTHLTPHLTPLTPFRLDGLNDTYASDTTKATQCVVVNQGYKPSDVKTFQSKYGLPNQV